MEAQHFDFFKARSISETINATFAFIRQEFIPLGKNLLFIVGPLMLLSAIINNLYIETSFNPDPEMIFTSDYWSHIFVLWLLQLAMITLMITVVNHYVLMYIRNDENRFSVQSILNVSVKDFWRILGISIVYTIMLSIAFVIFIIPGVYLFVALSLLYVILIHERLNFTEALNRSMQLIREYWWFTFAILILTWIIVYVLQLLFQIPLMAIGALYGFHEGAQEVLQEYSGWLAISTTISYLSNLFYAIVLIATIVHYYSQREKKEAAGLANRIDALDDTPAE